MLSKICFAKQIFLCSNLTPAPKYGDKRTRRTTRDGEGWQEWIDLFTPFPVPFTRPQFYPELNARAQYLIINILGKKCSVSRILANMKMIVKKY